jgi:hypothetical protein
MTGQKWQFMPTSWEALQTEPRRSKILFREALGVSARACAAPGKQQLHTPHFRAAAIRPCPRSESP